MRFNTPLIETKLIRRYKRFLADVEMPDGKALTVHCPNSGSMKGCTGEGWPAMISDSGNPKRKLRHTLEMTHNGQTWIGVNTMHPNKLAKEAIENGTIAELQGYDEIKNEQKYGENSRIDLLLRSSAKPDCYVEVKNVTLVENNEYRFPDAVTARGLKHLHELMEIKKKGGRAVMLFIIQRGDGTLFRPAADIDPVYAKRLKEAHDAGVEIMPWRAHVSPEEIEVIEKIPFVL